MTGRTQAREGCVAVQLTVIPRVRRQESATERAARRRVSQLERAQCVRMLIKVTWAKAQSAIGDEDAFRLIGAAVDQSIQNGKTIGVERRAVFACSEKAPWARAAARVLATALGIQAHPVIGTKAYAIAERMCSAKRRPARFSDDVCLIHLLGQPAHVACEGTATIRRLRNWGGHWPGGIVFVVEDEKTKTSLLQTDLFGGDPGGINSVARRYMAHRIIVEPVSLAAMLTEVCSVGQVLRLAWRAWIWQSPLGRIVPLLQEVRAGMCAEAEQHALGLFTDLHNAWCSVAWNRVCEHGAMQSKAMAITNLQIICPGDVHRIVADMHSVMGDLGLGEL